MDTAEKEVRGEQFRLALFTQDRAGNQNPFPPKIGATIQVCAVIREGEPIFFGASVIFTRFDDVGPVSFNVPLRVEMAKAFVVLDTVQEAQAEEACTLTASLLARNTRVVFDLEEEAAYLLSDRPAIERLGIDSDAYDLLTQDF